MTRNNDILKALIDLGETKSSFCKRIGISRVTFDKYLRSEYVGVEILAKIRNGLGW
jgi:transcriptional regulator with XRE-family HTH domain